jgi:penicillin-binding protein 1A
MFSSRRTRKAKKGSGKGRGRARTILGVLGLVGLVGVLAAGAGLLWLWPRCHGEDCPSVSSLREYTPPQASRVFDRTGVILTHLAPERRIVVPLERIPATVVGAFLAVEDRRFFQHDGIDYRRAAGAVIRDVQTLSFEQGFSTITMQLARNVFPEHLTREKTLRRKLWEIVLARQIEDEFGKDEILEMYLNQINLGNGLYGVEAAAQGYFGKRAQDLNDVEAALLAAIPKAPTTYNPRRNPVNARTRRDLVLILMADAGLISEQEARLGREQDLGLVPPMEAKSSAPYFVQAVRRELQERFGPDFETAGLRVFTSIDPDLQTAAQEAVREQLAAVEKGEIGNFRGTKCSQVKVNDPAVCLQGLFVAMDASMGDVLALVGGRDFALSQFDRVTQAERQPGSAFKPILYATALQQRIPITTPLVGSDSAGIDGEYRPADHVADTVDLDLRSGLRLSSNRAAVALGEMVGVDNVVHTAKELGLSTEIPPYPSTFLGAASVIPLELVSAYTVFANMGQRAYPRLILKVEDAHGKVLYESKIRREPVLSPEVAFLTTSLMRDVVEHGTGWRVRQALPAGVAAAGKTGTTNDATDTWFVGVTPDLAAASWVGYDTPKQIFRGAEGGNVASPIWGKAVAAYYEKHPVPPDWMPPFDLVSASIDGATGMLATEDCPPGSVRQEWFLPGTEPVDYCPTHGGAGVGGWLRRRMIDIGRVFGGDREGEQRLEQVPSGN